MFYLCSEANCNRKYKTKDKLMSHLLKDHDTVDPVIGEPVNITKENRKQVTNAANELKKQRELQEKEDAWRLKRQLKLEAKKKAEQEFMMEKMHEFVLIEQKKLEHEHKRLENMKRERELDDAYLNLVEKIRERSKVESTDCVICATAASNTAVVPCGHKLFCFECIDEYFKNYSQRGCPICRGQMLMITKILIDYYN